MATRWEYRIVADCGTPLAIGIVAGETMIHAISNLFSLGPIDPDAIDLRIREIKAPAPRQPGEIVFSTTLCRSILSLVAGQAGISLFELIAATEPDPAYVSAHVALLLRQYQIVGRSGDDGRMGYFLPAEAPE